jgi:hypothetical protein
MQPVYNFEVPLCRSLKIRPETGRRYRGLKVLVADAQTIDGRPLYLADAVNLERHKEAIRRHRARIARARNNLI